MGARGGMPRQRHPEKAWSSALCRDREYFAAIFPAGRFRGKDRRALQGTGLPGAFLEIKITESVLLDNEEGAILKLAELREMGVLAFVARAER